MMKFNDANYFRRYSYRLSARWAHWCKILIIATWSRTHMWSHEWWAQKLGSFSKLLCVAGCLREAAKSTASTNKGNAGATIHSRKITKEMKKKINGVIWDNTTLIHKSKRNKKPRYFRVFTKFTTSRASPTSKTRAPHTHFLSSFSNSQFLLLLTVDESKFVLDKIYGFSWTFSSHLRAGDRCEKSPFEV